jgi:hypothetical protein
VFGVVDGGGHAACRVITALFRVARQVPVLLGEADRGEDQLVGQHLEPLGDLAAGGTFQASVRRVGVGVVPGQAGAAVAAGRVE